MRFSTLKFVTVTAFILAAAVACSPGYETNENNVSAQKAAGQKKAVGLKSKAGQAVSASELCAMPATDANGKTTVATLRFLSNSDFIRRSRVMTTKSQFPVESETKGTWGMVGETLLITENNVTVKHGIDLFTKESDGAACVRFNNMENRPEFCACEF